MTISAQLTAQQQQTPNKTITTGWLDTNGKDLTTLADYITKNQLQIVVDSIYPLTTEGMRAAHQRSETHHARGKIVVEIKKETV